MLQRVAIRVDPDLGWCPSACGVGALPREGESPTTCAEIRATGSRAHDRRRMTALWRQSTGSYAVSNCDARWASPNRCASGFPVYSGGPSGGPALAV